MSDAEPVFRSVWSAGKKKSRCSTPNSKWPESWKKTRSKSTLFTVERQCDREFLEELDTHGRRLRCLISMACGVGIQFLAERFPDKPVFPAVDTSGLAVNQAVGWYEERCRSCSSCVLGWTGGICPVTMCAKGLYNGPCGGTNKGSCEINKDQPCAWYMIYERLAKQNRLDNLKIIRPANMAGSGAANADSARLSKTGKGVSAYVAAKATFSRIILTRI